MAWEMVANLCATSCKVCFCFCRVSGYEFFWHVDAGNGCQFVRYKLERTLSELQCSNVVVVVLNAYHFTTGVINHRGSLSSGALHMPYFFCFWIYPFIIQRGVTRDFLFFHPYTGVVNHHGSLSSGHYTCFIANVEGRIKGQTSWFFVRSLARNTEGQSVRDGARERRRER